MDSYIINDIKKKEEKDLFSLHMVNLTNTIIPCLYSPSI